MSLSITEQESRYLKALQTAGRWEFSSGHLLIWYEDGEGVLEFSPEDAAIPAAPATARPPVSQTPAGSTSSMGLPAVTPTEPPERVSIASGATSAERSSLLPSGAGVKQYVLEAQGGQTMQIILTSDGVPLSLIVEGPGGARWVSEAAEASGGYRTVQAVSLVETGDYRVTLAKAEHTPSTNYRVEFTLQ